MALSSRKQLSSFKSWIQFNMPPHPSSSKIVIALLAVRLSPPFLSSHLRPDRFFSVVAESHPIGFHMRIAQAEYSNPWPASLRWGVHDDSVQERYAATMAQRVERGT